MYHYLHRAYNIQNGIFMQLIRIAFMFTRRIAPLVKKGHESLKRNDESKTSSVYSLKIPMHWLSTLQPQTQRQVFVRYFIPMLLTTFHMPTLRKVYRSCLTGWMHDLHRPVVLSASSYASSSHHQPALRVHARGFCNILRRLKNNPFMYTWSTQEWISWIKELVWVLCLWDLGRADSLYVCRQSVPFHLLISFVWWEVQRRGHSVPWITCLGPVFVV